MGNTIKSDAARDPEGPGNDVAFFQAMNIRWLNMFITKIKDTKKSEFSLANTNESLKWSDYFRIFVEIKDSMSSESLTKERSVWHPATSGYAMTKRTSEEEETEYSGGSTPRRDPKQPPDDYTDDDPSEIGEQDFDLNEDQNERRTHTPRDSNNHQRSKNTSPQDGPRIPRNFDSRYVNPIYFGYSTETVQEQDRKINAEKQELRNRENRAIDRARATRSVAIDALERATTSQANARLDKIKKLEEKYEASRAKREMELERNERELLASAFAIYERKWEMESHTAEMAFETEVAKMRLIHEEKAAADALYLKNKREEMESFKDAEKQEIPAAERLEEFARIEVSRSIDELDKCSLEMDAMRLEYREMKRDYEEVYSEMQRKEAAGTIDKARQRQCAEMRSMVSVAETRMRESQRKVQECLEGLGDAEILLDRAVRLCKQQAELLPLFSLIAKGVHLPSHCRLNSLLISMVVLMQGPFEQKYTVLFRLFDSACEGRVGLQFVLSLFSAVQESLYLLKMLSSMTTKDELVNTVTRGFMSYHLIPTRDLLTEYELKHLVMSLVSHSAQLTAVLGLSARTSMTPGNITFDGQGGNMGTYQRHQMTPLALLSRGMININMCKLRVHYDSMRYKPALQPVRKQKIHELALLMGADDPLKPDYSRFYVKQDKVDAYAVPPLDHGHLQNVRFVSHRIRNKAAVKIQAWFRSGHDRKMAELAARHMAFKEAKNAALKEMKAKVVREFKKREGGKGMGKMKWDAQVRMKQAKLRTMGQAVGRSETVMVMMEEAIQTAKDDIEVRFKDLESKEAFSTFNFDRPLITDDPARQVLNLEDKFGLLMKPSIADKSMLTEDTNKNTTLLDTDEEENNDVQAHKKPHKVSNNQEPESVGPDKIPSIPPSTSFTVSAMIVMDPTKVRSYVQGKFFTPFLLAQEPPAENQIVPRGEDEMEFELRMLMAGAEPFSQDYLFNRLRAVNIAMTKFKTGEFIGEIPSKRLLLKYIANHDDESLIKELTAHFKFKNRQAQIVKVLRNLSRTDLENGTIKNHLFNMQLQSESGILHLFESQMKSFLDQLSSMIDLRLATNRKLKEEMVLEEELKRIEAFVMRFRDQSQAIMSEMDIMKGKFQKVLLSCFEVEKKFLSMKRYQEQKNGTLDLVKKDVPLELRQNWILRINEAIRMPQHSLEAQNAKYSEIRNVCREFLTIATSDAIIIINEIHQPKYLKTIPVVEQGTVDGRAMECGRGFEKGRFYIYEAHNIVYKVALDYHGIFNGSDENAMKAAGAERLGAQEYFKLQTPRLQVPLVTTIDYLGFRILCTSKLPIQNVIYNDEGEVRKISTDLEHGVILRGEQYVNKSKVVQTYLKICAQTLNLAQHVCKGSKDITSSSTWGSADLQVYQNDSVYYMNNFWRAFPPELPQTTPHLHTAAREQSVYWRYLRPEYVKAYKTALSPDTCCTLTYKASDAVLHAENLTTACTQLVNNMVPKYVLDLLEREFVIPLSEGYGIDFSAELHAQGINIRHLGLMRSLLWHDLPGTVNMYHHEDYIRTSSDLRLEVSNGDYVTINNITYRIEETKKRKITHAKIPISTKYAGESTNNLTATCGTVKIPNKSFEIRTLLLAEMIVRTMKNIVRLQMRTYNEQYQCSSSTFFTSLVVEYLNILTGSNANSDVVLQQTICESVRERYGIKAILPSERVCLQKLLRPVLSYAINRLVTMLGVKLNISCESEFHERPVAFVFSVADIHEISPVCKHNIPILPYADAMVVSLQAYTIEQAQYLNIVLQSQPVLLYTLSERHGSRAVGNKGSLGSDFTGTIKHNAELEQAGPIVSDKFIRSVCFRPNAKAYIDVPHHNALVPNTMRLHFSVECYYKVTGGKDTVRTILMCGRYAIQITRDNRLSVQFYEAQHEISIKLNPVEYNTWVHLICTYDATTVRVYVNSILTKAVEVAPVLAFKQAAYSTECEVKRQELQANEKSEQIDVYERSQREATEFFQTKDGVATLKRLSREIMESEEFQSENIGINAKDQPAALKEKRVEALKRAKALHMRNHYHYNIEEISKRYEVLGAELEDNLVKIVKESQERCTQSMRIGANTKNSSSDSSNYFYGNVSCVSVYNYCMSSDKVKEHYITSVIDRRLDAQRMHAIAASKFELALRQSANDTDSGSGMFGSAAAGAAGGSSLVSSLATGTGSGATTALTTTGNNIATNNAANNVNTGTSVLNSYARSLCSYLRIPTTDANNMGKVTGKIKIIDTIQHFKSMKLANAIAEICNSIPREAEFADLISAGFLSIKSISKNYFSRGECLTRKDIVHFPFDYALISPESPRDHWECAAYIFQEVVRDTEMMFIYGELDLRFLSELQSAPLMISIVKMAMEDKNLRIVRFADIFQESGITDMDVTDDDVLVLSQNLPISEGFDLTNCIKITNTALSHLDRMNNLKVLSLNHCVQIDDRGLKNVRTLFAKLTVLSFEGLIHITDEGLSEFALKCKSLQQINFNKCVNVSSESIAQFCRNNPLLNTLLLSNVFINDESFSSIVSALNTSGSAKTLTNLDISMCKEITDIGICALSEVCTAVTKLNMSGLHRVSDVGMRSVCGNMWYLQHLNAGDVFLLKSECFWFSPTQDGRRAANENMLVSLQHINLTDCSHLTDKGIEGLAERCRKVDVLILQGCDKLTDTSLRHIADNNLCTSSNIAMCDTIHTLNLSYSTGLTSSGILALLPMCACLESIDLSGLASIVNDKFVQNMAKACPTLQKLILQKCLLLTDSSLCSLADNLWLEHVDLTGCNKITDSGIEVLTEACNGLRSVTVRRSKRLTNKTMFAIMRNCKGIQRIDVQDCPLIAKESVMEAKLIKPAVVVLF